MERVTVERGISRREDGKYVIGWRDAGSKQRWRVVEGGLKAARAALAAEHAKRAKGEMVPQAPRLTFRAAADSWWDVRATAHTRPQSQRAYRRQLDALLAEFGGMRLNAITPVMVADHITKSGCKGWTLKQRLWVMSAIYRNAIRRLGHVGQIPSLMLDSTERPTSEDATPKRILTDEELTALLDALAPEHRLIFELMAQTGLRMSEARGLIWNNIDWNELTLTVDAQLSRANSQRIPTKTTRSMRTIALAPTLVGKLREHRVATGRPFGGEFIFRHRGGVGQQGRQAGTRAPYRMRPYSFSSINQLIQRARDRAGLGPVMSGGVMIARAPVPHDLRHTHASKLIVSGWSDIEVAARLGDHVLTVLRTYAHEWDAARRRKDQGARLDALYPVRGSAGGAPGVAGGGSSADPVG
jgi:integrase